MSNKMSMLAVAAVLLAVVPAALAQTYTYVDKAEDRSTYANVSTDVCAIKKAAGAGDWATAQQIYSVGKYAYRNIEAGTFRFAQGFATNNYTGEAWYDLFKGYYKTDAPLDKMLGAAINGTGMYTNSVIRAASVSAWAQIYPFLYTLHEFDVAYLSMVGSEIKEIAPGEVADSIEEIDDAYAIYKGDGGACALANVVNSVFAKSCIKSKAANPAADVLKGFKAAQAAAVAYSKAMNEKNIPSTGAKIKAGRDLAADALVRAWASVVLQQLKIADAAKPGSSEKWTAQATALAYSQAIAPFVSGWYDARAATTVLSTVMDPFAKKPKVAKAYPVVAKALSGAWSSKKKNFAATVYGC